MIIKSNNEIKLQFVSILIYRLSLLMRTTGRYAAVPPFKKTVEDNLYEIYRGSFKWNVKI